MIILNFGHPLTAAVLEQLAECPHLDSGVNRIIDIKVQADISAPFADQAAALADAVGWSGAQWQGNPFVIVPPGLAPLALALVAEIHGRAGYFPGVIRLKPVQGAVPPRFDFAEVIGLAAIREQARTRR